MRRCAAARSRFHAMRGISAHSNGFQTCRALHLLQILLGTIDVPGGWRYKSPLSQSRRRRARSRPASPAQVAAGKPLAGRAARLPDGARGSDPRRGGRPPRIDKAFSWDAPIAAHGLMHMLIRNCWNGDPYPIDTLFMYMANMAWNSAMNTAETMRMLTDKDPATGEYRIPRDHLFRRLLFRDGRLCRPGPARHDLSRALGLHLAARPADRRGRRPRRLDPPADPHARPRRAAVPGRADRIGRAARPAGLCQRRRRAALSRRLQGLYRAARARAGHRAARRLARRGRDRAPGRGAPNPGQLDRYVANGCFWKYELPPEQLYYKHANKAYLETRDGDGADRRRPTRSSCSFMSSRCSASASRRRGMARPCRRKTTAPRIETYFDPLPFWYRAVRGGARRPAAVSRCTRSPSGRCRCTIPGTRRMPGCGRSSARTGCS